LSGGITQAAATMAQPNAYSATGNLLSGVAQNPMVTGAINNAFGVQSSAPKYQIINGQLVHAPTVDTTTSRVKDPILRALDSRVVGHHKMRH